MLNNFGRLAVAGVGVGIAWCVTWNEGLDSEWGSWVFACFVAILIWVELPSVKGVVRYALGLPSFSVSCQSKIWVPALLPLQSGKPICVQSWILLVLLPLCVLQLLHAQPHPSHSAQAALSAYPVVWIVHIQSRFWAGLLWMPASQWCTSSTLFLGGTALSTHTTHTLLVLYLPQPEHFYTYEAPLSLHTCSLVCGCYNILLAWYSLQVGNPECPCSSVGTQRSTQPYPLDQSLGGLVMHAWCPPISAGFSSKNGDWEHTTVPFRSVREPRWSTYLLSPCRGNIKICAQCFL